MKIDGTADTQINEIIMIDNVTSKFCRHSVKHNVLLRYVDVMKCYRRLASVHVSRSVLEANNALQQPHIDFEVVIDPIAPSGGVLEDIIF